VSDEGHASDALGPYLLGDLLQVGQLAAGDNNISASALAAPIPRLPPLITATFPLRDISVLI
jgi:hypothetical protein